jgi:DNA-binding response OmpR family regulator
MPDPATLLLVEDDPVIRTFLADNLTADGYDLLVAATLEEAMRELEYKRPDIAIVDLKLPDGSGSNWSGGCVRRTA